MSPICHDVLLASRQSSKSDVIYYSVACRFISMIVYSVLYRERFKDFCALVCVCVKVGEGPGYTLKELVCTM